jgi:ATP-dependent helicase/nuclease subunit B
VSREALVIPGSADLVEEAARLIEESGSPPGECLVVFPGERPAHFLRRRLAASRRGPFIPPRILTRDACADAAFEAQEARAGRVLPRIEDTDAVALLHDLQLASEHPLGGRTFIPLDNFYPVGLRIWSDLEELCLEGVPAREVAGVQPLVEEEVPRHSRERLMSLAWFYEAFYPEVERRGFSTRALRYRRAAERLAPADIPEAGLILLAGFFELRGAERTLIQTIAGWPQARLLFQDGPGLRERIADLAGPAAPAGPEAPRPDARFYDGPDDHGQVFALNAALGEPDDDTVIVVPKTDSLFPLLNHCLSRFQPEAYNISLPYPLQRTPLYGLMNGLMELVSSMDGERVYLPHYLTVVLHPYVKNLRCGASAEATRVLFHALEERLADRGAREFASLERLESDAALFDVAALRLGGGDPTRRATELSAHLRSIHDRTVRRFRAFKDVRDFAGRCAQLVSWIHDESTARDHPFFTDFAGEFMESMDKLSHSLMAEKRFQDTGGYFTLLRRLLAEGSHHFSGTPVHGMQVLGRKETRGLMFKRVFVLDANEGVLPSAPDRASLLPHAVRLALKLRTRHDAEDEDAYHFSVLAAGARELHLFSRASGENERSRFAERLLWERQKAESRRNAAELVTPIRYRMALSNPLPRPVEKTPAVVEWLRGFPYSATALDAYLRCPLRFYNRHVLGLSQREEVAGEIDARQVGTFVHEVLGRYFTGRTGRPLTGDDADPAAVSALTRAMFQKTFGDADAGANRLLCNRICSRLSGFMRGYLRDRVGRSRLAFGELEKRLETTRRGFTLRGQLDVIGELDGRPCLIDYKTSAKRAYYELRLDKLDPDDRDTWSEAAPTLQLPVYVMLNADRAGADPTETRALFLLLGRSAQDLRMEVPLFEDQAAARDGWPRVERIVDSLLDEIASPGVPFAPARDLRSACPSCDFMGLCGTTWLARR